MSSLNRLQRQLINQFQGGFPLARQPFSCVAASLGVGEASLFKTLKGLLDTGYLSRFGPLYNAEKIGGEVTLAALSASERNYDRVADMVNRYPQVAHNYRRDHQLNMWFVISAEHKGDIENVIQAIELETGLKVYNFPREKAFYLGLFLQLDEDGSVDTVSMPEEQPAANHILPDEQDKKIISLTQSGLPLVSDPWASIAQQLNMPEDALLQRMQKMQDAGIIRRIGVIPNHYRLGLKANGMSVWNIPDERAIELGEKVAALDFVSHCYLRPRYESLWPYNLFAMVHGSDKAIAREKADKIKALLGEDCLGGEVLFSSAILKKTGFRRVA